jgi:hypothetical protein
LQLSRWSSVDVLWRWPVSGASRSLRFPTLSESRSPCLQRWMKLDDVDAGRVEGTTSDERAELVRLPRELRVAKMAIEILKKASAYIADPCSPRFPHRTGPDPEPQDRASLDRAPSRLQQCIPRSTAQQRPWRCSCPAWPMTSLPRCC